MTTREKIYAHILKYKKKHGVVPSARSLSKEFGMTPQGMALHYSALILEGKLKKVSNVAMYETVDNQVDKE